MDQRVLTEKVNMAILTMPQPTVSEISMLSPPRNLLPDKISSKINTVDEIAKKSKTSNVVNSKPPPSRLSATQNAPKNVSTKQLNVAKTSFPVKKSSENNDLADLKLQLKHQNSEINELKQLVRQLAVQKSNDNESKSAPTQQPDPVLDSSDDQPKSYVVSVHKLSDDVSKTSIDVSVQTEFPCPHCDKSLTLASNPKQSKRVRVADNLKANLRTKNSHFNLSDIDFGVTMHEPSIRIDPNELSMLDSKLDSYNQPSVTPEHQFIDRMLGAAEKWLKPQNTQQISSKSSKVALKNANFAPANQFKELNEPANPYWSYLLKEAENNQGLSLEINSLATRYLNDDHPTDSSRKQNQKWSSSRKNAIHNQKTSYGVGPSSPMGPMAMATHRQTVTMESEVSLIGMVPHRSDSTEISLSSAEFLRRHGLMQSLDVGGRQPAIKYSTQRNANWSNNRAMANDYCTSSMSTITERSTESELASKHGCNNGRRVCDCCTSDEFSYESDIERDFASRGHKKY